MAIRRTTYDYLFPIGCLLVCRVLDLMTEHACDVFANLSIVPSAGMMIGYSIGCTSVLTSIVLSDIAAELQAVLCLSLISLSTELTTELWSLYLGDLIAGVQRVWGRILMRRIRTLTSRSLALNRSTATFTPYICTTLQTK